MLYREEFFLTGRTGHKGKVTTPEQNYLGELLWKRSGCRYPREPPALVLGGSLEAWAQPKPLHAELAQEALEAQEAASETLGFHPRICLWAGSWNLVEFFE